jgi:hypothetical protein
MGCYSLPAAKGQSLAQITTQDVPSSALVSEAAQPLIYAQEAKPARIPLQKIKLSDDWRAHAWI